MFAKQESDRTCVQNTERAQQLGEGSGPRPREQRTTAVRRGRAEAEARAALPATATRRRSAGIRLAAARAAEARGRGSLRRARMGRRRALQKPLPETPPGHSSPDFPPQTNERVCQQTATLRAASSATAPPGRGPLSPGSWRARPLSRTLAWPPAHCRYRRQPGLLVLHKAARGRKSSCPTPDTVRPTR